MDDIINKIQEDHPLCGEYADDARYTWPKRWDALIAALRASLEEAERESDRLTMIAEEISKQATIEHYNMEDARKSLSVIQKRHALELAAAQARAERAEKVLALLDAVKADAKSVANAPPGEFVRGLAFSARQVCKQVVEAVRLANATESVTSEPDYY